MNPIQAKKIKLPLAPSLSPLGGERVASGRVRDLLNGILQNVFI
jgi:hypothetical protein